MWTTEQIPLKRLLGPAVVIDGSEQVADTPDYQVTQADIETWEATHGPLPDGVIVLLRTGYGSFWPNRERYMGTAERGADAVAQLHFPGLHPGAALWLVANRTVQDRRWQWRAVAHRGASALKAVL